jgi:uncharacterized protein YcnI
MSASVNRVSKLAAVGAVAALAVLAVAGPAFAHVTANPSTAVQGSYTKVSFRVPNEMEGTNTTQLVIDLPLDHPIASVSVRPVPGWTVTVSKSKLPTPIKSDDSEITQAVSKIVWSKGTIAPGQFQEFDVSMGPLPTDTDTLAFKAAQTYSNGQVVNWDQAPLPGGKEPDHPAPALHLTKATDPAAGMGAMAGGSPSPKAVATSAAVTSDDGTARLLGGLGLAVGLVGIAVGGLGLARARGRSS